MHITWCVYALFVEDEARVQRDCKYEVKPFLDNRAQSFRWVYVGHQLNRT